MAVNRNFARTPGRRVSQTPDSHASPICQLPGPPGIPPPAALTSVICNGFLLRFFAFRRPSSFFFRRSSAIFVHRLPLSFSSLPFSNLPISRPPRLPDAGAAGPTVFGGPRTRRKFPGGSFRNKEDPGGTLFWTSKTAQNGGPATRFRPQST